MRILERVLGSYIRRIVRDEVFMMTGRPRLEGHQLSPKLPEQTRDHLQRRRPS